MMKGRGRLVWMFVVVLAAFSAGRAGAGPILATHVGNTDPATEGWTLYNASGGTVGGGTETTASGTYDYWQVAHPSTLSSPNHYRYDLSPGDLDGDDWVASARIRVVDSRYHAWGLALPFGMFLIRDDWNTWGLLLGNDIVGVMDSHGHFARSLPMDTRSDYHLYEVYFHANGPGIADDTTDVFIDGTLVFPNVTRAEVPDISSYGGSLRGVYIGSGSSGAYTIVNYGDLTLGPPTVPEPATLGLFGLLAGGAAWRRRRRAS